MYDIMTKQAIDRLKKATNEMMESINHSRAAATTTAFQRSD